MNLSDLYSPAGARSKRKRIGRGHGSGHEKTAGFGQKGAKARTGHHKMPRHKMGGQTPIQQQLPYKRGFKNPFRPGKPGARPAPNTHRTRATEAAPAGPAPTEAAHVEAAPAPADEE